MKRAMGWIGLVAGFALCAGAPRAAWAEEPADGAMAIFDFEDGLDGWVIPEWSVGSADYVGKTLELSSVVASHGRQSAELTAAFSGMGNWTAAYAEVIMNVTDWSAFSQISADVYLPENAPKGLLGRLIVTVGDQWQWTERNRPADLEPGTWVTLTADLRPGSMDWKFFPDESFRKDVRKFGVRVESDKVPVYSGPIYIDNIRLSP